MGGIPGNWLDPPPIPLFLEKQSGRRKAWSPHWGEARGGAASGRGQGSERREGALVLECLGSTLLDQEVNLAAPS